ncbi:MAG: AsmA family protein [Paludibacteraceae bacterium]|nr:AsmA family protein [Paludibacteraceae bacterium]
MKRFFKIVGITLGSLLALVIVVASVAVWCVFTPDKLTPVVRQVSDKFISCEHEVGNVDMTFFSTFPEFGLHVDGLYLINPMPGVQSDTLLAAPSVVARINVMEFVKNKNLIVRELSLPDVQANVFINEQGDNNFSVFITSPDTTQEDTTAFSLPFNGISVEGLSLTSPRLSFVDKKDSVDALLLNTELSGSVDGWDDVLVKLQSESVSATLGNTQYANNLQLKLRLPAEVYLDSMHFVAHEAELAINEFELGLDGTVDLQPDLKADMKVETNTWEIEPLLALLPRSITDGIKDLRLKGNLQLAATAQMDMTTKQSHVHLSALNANVWNSSLSASGDIDDLLGKMWLNVGLKIDLPLKDAARWIPQNMSVQGRVSGKAAAKIYLDDLIAMQLEKGHINGDLKLQGIDFQMDSLLASFDQTRLQFAIPNAQPSYKTVNWLGATLDISPLDFKQLGTLSASLDASTLKVESGNILSKGPVLYAAVALQSKGSLTAAMDSMNATIQAPELTAYAEYDTKDTTQIPVLKANVTFDDLQGNYTNIVGHLQKSALQASITGGKRNKSVPVLSASISTDALQAAMGDSTTLQTAALTVSAKARYNSKADQILLKWNPKLEVVLKQGVAKVPALQPIVQIPQIKFAYSNRQCVIDTSRIILGNSDFCLSGEVKNIGKWLQKKDTLEGVLNFTSARTNVNEFMEWFSADKGSEEKEVAAQTTTPTKTQAEGEPKPFLVPTDVNLTLNTHIDETVVFNQTARNLGGRIYVQDGKLVLEEVGFVCRAAKLQLTAMYRSPRANHLYLGFDYHMLDVNIQELINMIPDLSTMVPMLSSFKGNAEFHLAAETYLFSNYKPKTSTLRGACSLFGKDLVVLDSETFSTISKLLMFNKKTENRVDSISAEITLYKDEIDVYPFCVSIDNYMAALGGRHNLDMSFDYHVNLLKPLYIGVDVSGTFDDLNIKLAPCRYAQDFRPLFHGKVNTQSAELRAIIRESMRKNVKIQ